MIPAGASRRPFSHEIIDVLEPLQPPILSFHFGLPAPDMLARIRRWNPFILSTATTLAEAEWLQANGVDAVIAQGLEAGGHRGMFLTQDLSTQVGTLALLPQIAARLSVPVIAAGGIADAKGVRAALALGAAAVQVGTSYLLCNEAQTKPLHRRAIKSPAARHTAITNLFSGGHARGIVNRVMREIGPLNSQAPPYPLAAAAMNAVRSIAESQEKSDFSPLWCGQNATGCQERSAAAVTVALAEELG